MVSRGPLHHSNPNVPQTIHRPPRSSLTGQMERWAARDCGHPLSRPPSSFPRQPPASSAVHASSPVLGLHGPSISPAECWLSPAIPQEGTVCSALVLGVLSIVKPQGLATQQALGENLVGGGAGTKAVPQQASYKDSSLNSTGQGLR